MTYLSKTLKILFIMMILISYELVSSGVSDNSKMIYSDEVHQMSIVIDDFGNNMEGTEAMFNLAVPITVAVMPFMPSTEKDARTAHEAGHEVIVHMPMEPNKGLSKWLGPGSIKSNLTDQEVREHVEAAIDNVPYAIGMNNHMGSKITADERIMRIVLTVCKERKLFFLDSRTTPKSVIPKIATELGVPYIVNQLFLDDVYTVDHIQKQMNKAVALLEKSPNSVIIGHVGPSGKITSSVIQKALPLLQQKGEIIPISKMIQQLLIDPQII